MGLPGGPTPASPANPGARHNSIGLLRLVLAALVVYGHSWYLGGFGPEVVSIHLFRGAVNLADIGVQGFFALSGYLVLASERRSHCVRDFLWNRGLRIYPGLWFCLLLTGLLLPAVLWTIQRPASADWAGAFGYFWRNLLLPRTQITVAGIFPDVPKAGDLNGSLWTLPYELGCYGLLAFAGWLGLTRPHSPLPWIAGSLLAALYLFDVSFPERALFFVSPGRRLAAWFICGALLALVPEDRLRRHLRAGALLLAAAAYVLACRFGWALQIGPPAVAIVTLALAWMLPFQNFEKRVRGDYSYGLYIYAYPMQQGLAQEGVPRFGVTVYFLLSLFLALPLAVASWHWVEKHAQRHKRRAGVPLP